MMAVAGSSTSRHGRALLLLALLLAAVAGAWLARPRDSHPGAEVEASPLSTERLCRFGVNDAGYTGADFDLSPLRAGWYIDYSAQVNPPLSDEATYTRVIHLKQEADGSSPPYSFFPPENDLLAAVQANPGADWLIGNEPDSPFQDSMEPQVYAQAYHDIYQLIKGADPGARIFAGNIVQPTALRLLYLDLVLEAYLDAYGEPLPVDGWSIHNFILREVCDTCDDAWGAGIPPGIDADYGELLDPWDNDDLDLFKERITRFRRWMYERGYGGLPLYLSEYGILFPEDYVYEGDPRGPGFPPERVNAFMDATFDYLREARHGTYGYAADDRRLVQRWSWYSTDDDFFNGWLYDEPPGTLSAMGVNYREYVAGVAAYHDLMPGQIWTTPASPFSQGGPVDLTLWATVGNAGNMQELTGPSVVQFYEGDPSTGGSQIGPDHVVSLAGCGDSATVSVSWPQVAPGLHRVYVVVDALGQVDEGGGAYEGNNTRMRPVLVATERTFLPIARR
jgi:hypothetical protein